MGKTFIFQQFYGITSYKEDNVCPCLNPQALFRTAMTGITITSYSEYSDCFGLVPLSFWLNASRNMTTSSCFHRQPCMRLHLNITAALLHAQLRNTFFFQKELHQFFRPLLRSWELKKLPGKYCTLQQYRVNNSESN